MTDDDLTPEHADFYQRLRARITAHKGPWIEILLAAPDLFYLLCKLMRDPTVTAAQKTMIAATLAYFISPIDLIPEAIVGPIGFLDDVSLAALAMNTALNQVDIATVRAHWRGREDVLVVTQKVANLGSTLLGARIWAKLRRRVGR